MKKNKYKQASSHWGSSLKRVKWDEKIPITNTRALIGSTVSEWYEAKHRSSSDEEIRLLNERIRDCCPHCESSEIVRNGFYKNKLQRYRCKDCGKNFSPITNTIFEGKKIPISEWVEYLIHLFEFHSLRTCARDNRNAETTGKYWLLKVFEVLRGIQDDVVLEGAVYFDETFFPVAKRKTITRGGKELRGISRNKLCVAMAYDSGGRMLMIVENTSKPSIASTWKALGSHIKEGSRLVHDGEKSHGVLIRRLNLSSEVHKSSETKNLDDNKNPLEPINKIHSLSKRFIREHGGYDRDDLQDWMNLIWFILSKPENRYEKVEKFIDLALNSPKRVKFRDAMIKKTD